jgi:RNA polymerase sigma-70 factor, ECF subfamily
MMNPWVQLTDSLLAEKIMAGDAAAYGAVYDRYAPALLRHLMYRTPNRETAEDLLSKTFLKVWEYVRSGKKIKYLRQFLYTSAQNALTDFYRRKDYSDVLADDLTDYDRPDENERTIVMLDRDFDRATLDEALAKIKPAFRDILVMRYIDELEIEEAAVALSVTSNAVYVRTHRALKALKEVLENDFSARLRSLKQ